MKYEIHRMRAVSLLLCLLLTPLLCAGCAKKKDEGLSVVATLFPQYDFARVIAADQIEAGTMTLTLLLPPGMESHSYEPTPADLVAVSEADLFLYTGDHMEGWVSGIVSSLPESVHVVDVSAGLSLDKLTYDASEHAVEAHDEYDPHIWTDPTMALTMVGNVADGLCTVDPAHTDAYRANAKAYNEELLKLDTAFTETVAQGKRKEICFGGRFALHYFAKRYGLDYIAAYDSCSEETEPSARAIIEIMDRIRTDGIPVIYYEELVDPQVARSIAEETGTQMLLLHSCHNVSAADLESGVSYLSLMRQNLENLRIGLN